MSAAGVDVIVITRGGGSRADLSWFDQQDLAVAIARCPVPVITAIGHEIDTSIADLVAHHACKTPTAAAEFLVDGWTRRPHGWTTAAERLAGGRGRTCWTTAGRRIDRTDRLRRACRGRLAAGRGCGSSDAPGVCRTGGRAVWPARHGVLARSAARLGAAAVTRMARAREKLGGLRIGIGAPRPRDMRRRPEQRRPGRDGCGARRCGRVSGQTRLENLATQARLLDPARLLARGYTITLDADGQGRDQPADAGARRHHRHPFRRRARSAASSSRAAATTDRHNREREKQVAEKKTSPKDPGQKTLFR